MGNHQTSNGIGKTVTKVAAASGLVAIFGAAAAMGAPAAVAESNTSSSQDVQTTVRKSVSLSGAPDGTIKSSSSMMVTAVSSVGNGQATVTVPVGADSARNLDGFSSVPVKGQNAQFTVNPKGIGQEQRIVTSSNDGPIKVKATATLDGKPINPADIVGKTGVLAVNYAIVNTETKKQTVTYKDVNGNDVTSEVDVAAPIGGSVDIVLPQGFNEITATGANIGGDGSGGTKLSYSLVLFEPLGNRVANIGYQTRITDGTLPQAQFTFLPIIPLENSTIATTKEAYTGGAKTGATIYGAGVEIGDNLLKLQAGAAKLTAGLAKAADGASQLADGLNNKVVPGANALASGADTLAGGLSGDLNGGMTTLNAGLKALQAGVNGLPTTVKAQVLTDRQYQLAVGGLGQLASNGPKAAAAAKIVSGQTAITVPIPGVYKYECIKPPTFPFPALLPSCADIVNGFEYPPGTYNAGINDYIAGATQIGTLLGPTGVDESGLLTTIMTIMQGVKASLLGTVKDPALNALVAGGQQIQAGLEDKIIPGANALAAGANTLADGLPAAADGATQIADGLPAAVEGTGKIEEGAGELKTKGADKLATSGETAESEYAFKVAQINAIQTVGLSGSNIPYGPATGPNTKTTGVYQLTLAPASTGASNLFVFELAALGLIVAGGAGVFVWRRRVQD